AVWEVEHFEVFALTASEIDCVEGARARDSGPAELDGVYVWAQPSVGAHGEQPSEASACGSAAAVLDSDTDPETFAAVLAFTVSTPGLRRFEDDVDAGSAQVVEEAERDERGHDHGEERDRSADPDPDRPPVDVKERHRDPAANERGHADLLRRQR